MTTIRIEFAGRHFFLESADGRDQVARDMASGAYEAPLPMLTLATLLCVDGAFVDVGANSGLYSILAGLIPNRRVEAFEPLQAALEAFRHNLVLNQMIDRVVIHEVALSDRRGSATLHIPDPSHGMLQTSASLQPDFLPAHSMVDVSVRCLDEFEFGRVGLIKVDIEGHEHAFLGGAKSTIMRDRPIIFAEVLHLAKRDRIGAFLHDVDYMDFRLRPGMAIHDDEVIFDLLAWNHAFVPIERLPKFKEICEATGLELFRRFTL
jgi:FkbM family methyltransferase